MHTLSLLCLELWFRRERWAKEAADVNSEHLTVEKQTGNKPQLHVFRVIIMCLSAVYVMLLQSFLLGDSWLENNEDYDLSCIIKSGNLMSLNSSLTDYQCLCLRALLLMTKSNFQPPKLKDKVKWWVHIHPSIHTNSDVIFMHPIKQSLNN